MNKMHYNEDCFGSIGLYSLCQCKRAKISTPNRKKLKPGNV